jgi:hypothetical protein
MKCLTAAARVTRLESAIKSATIMSQYKGHPVYGIAVAAPGHRWGSRGLVFDRDLTQTIEIKRIETSTELTFRARRHAEEYGLKLCRDWIDEQAAVAI